jgi:hypothetical protein
MRNSLRKLQSNLMDRLCKHRIVFHHVPKCGGNSVGKALPKRYLLSRRTISPLKIMCAVDAVRNGHKPQNQNISNFLFRQTLFLYLLLKDFHFIWGHVEFNETAYTMFKNKYHFITMLRDPIDRFISNYFYDHSYDADNPLKINCEIADFVKMERGIHFGRRYCEYFSGMPLTDHFDEKTAVHLAKKNLHKFSVVGFIENPEDFSEKFKKITGYKIKLGHKNKGPVRRHIIDRSVRPEIREHIQKLCASDIEIYEYARRNF